MNPINPNPAAAVASATTPSVVETWRAVKEHSAVSHGLYSLARLNYSAHRADGEYENVINSQEFVDRALRKMVRTFSPITSLNKLGNGCRPFQTLFSVLDFLKARADRCERFGIALDEATELRNLASLLFTEARARKANGLMEFAPPAPARREKKPYNR